MESTGEGKRGKEPAAREGRGGGRGVCPATPIYSKFDVKRFSYVWKKASPYRR